MTSPFDLDSSDEAGTDAIAPLWTIDDLDNAEKVLAWMNSTYATELRRIASYRQQALKHISLFRGRFYADQNSRGSFAEASQAGLGNAPTKVSKLVVNHLYDLVMQRVSRITRNKPAVTINPANAEYSDRISAKVVKYWTDYELYRNNFERLIAECAQAAFIIGEAYIGSFWNPEMGEVHPDWAEEEAAATNEGRPPRIQVLDDDGDPVLSEAGEPLWIEKPVKTGDVELKMMTPLDTIVESCGDFHKATYFIYEQYHDINELRAKYKNVAEEILSEGPGDGLDKWREIAGTIGYTPGKVLVRYFYHRPTEFLASGRFIMSTKGAILENKPLPPRQRGLPLARLTDIDIPGEQRGMSFFVPGKSINATINDLTSMARRNALLLAHPKWVIPRGSIVKKDALGNDIAMIEYMGPTPPKLEAPPAMSGEIMSLRESLKQDLQQILGSSDVSRGKVPPNVRSALALQMLDDAEQERANSGVAKHGILVRETVQKMINLASAYYKPEDKRLIPIVGRDNLYLIKQFDPDDLSKSYSVRVADSTGMPTSKAAQTEILTELRKTFGDKMIKDEQVVDILQLGDSERYYDLATVAVKAAEAENESIMSREGDEEPAMYEDHVVHWSSHMKEVQNRGFKTATPEDVQSKMILHIMAHEMMMMQAARKNPAFSLSLVQLPQFPAFFDLSHEDRILMDRARTGNPLTLLEIEALYTTGMLPPGMGTAPQPGGIPDPAAGAALNVSQGPVPVGQPMVPPESMQPAAPEEAPPQ